MDKQGMDINNFISTVNLLFSSVLLFLLLYIFYFHLIET